MARTLSAAVTTLKDTKRAHTRMLFDLDVAGTLYYWADESLSFGGNTYGANLIVDDAVRNRRSLQLDTAAVTVQNVTLFASELLKTEFLPGSKATLRRLFLEAEEAVTIFEGLVGAAEIDEPDMQLRLVSALDPTAARAPERFYSNLCTWKFKSPECGYVGALQTCNKTFADCVVRVQEHRFNAFVHITRELTQSVPPATEPPPVDPRTDFLGNRPPFWP